MEQMRKTEIVKEMQIQMVVPTLQMERKTKKEIVKVLKKGKGFPMA